MDKALEERMARIEERAARLEECVASIPRMERRLDELADRAAQEELRAVLAEARRLTPVVAALAERAYRCFMNFDDVPGDPADDVVGELARWEAYWASIPGLNEARAAVTTLAAHACAAVGEAPFPKDAPDWLVTANDVVAAQ